MRGRLSQEDYPTPAKAAASPDAACLQGVQIGEQILNILRAHHLTVAGHIRAAIANNVSDAIIVRGQAAEGKILMLEYSLHSRPFFPFRGVGSMTAVAVVVVKLPSGCLVRIETEFGIGFTALYVAPR